jgi:hypothetical protein
MAERRRTADGEWRAEILTLSATPDNRDESVS